MIPTVKKQRRRVAWQVAAAETAEDLNQHHLPQLNQSALRKLEQQSSRNANRSMAVSTNLNTLLNMHSPGKLFSPGPVKQTGKLFVKNKETIEDTLIRKMKEKYLP